MQKYSARIYTDLSGKLCTVSMMKDCSGAHLHTYTVARMPNCKSALLHLIYVDGYTECSYMQSKYRVAAQPVVLHEKYAWL